MFGWRSLGHSARYLTALRESNVLGRKVVLPSDEIKGIQLVVHVLLGTAAHNT